MEAPKPSADAANGMKGSSMQLHGVPLPRVRRRLERRGPRLRLLDDPMGHEARCASEGAAHAFRGRIRGMNTVGSSGHECRGYFRMSSLRIAG
jgi:hypothetical protein